MSDAPAIFLPGDLSIGAINARACAGGFHWYDDAGLVILRAVAAEFPAMRGRECGQGWAFARCRSSRGGSSMCDFLSGFIHRNAAKIRAKDKRYVFGDLRSHSESAKLAGTKYGHDGDVRAVFEAIRPFAAKCFVQAGI